MMIFTLVLLAALVAVVLASRRLVGQDGLGWRPPPVTRPEQSRTSSWPR